MFDYLDLLEVLALLAVIFAALDALLIAAFWIWLARRSAPRRRVPQPAGIPINGVNYLQTRAHTPEEMIEICDMQGNVKWVRPPGHPDLEEMLNTPGYVLRYSDGSIEYGRQ